MKNKIVSELNEIQREWMALDPFAPEAEKQRVFRLMERYPKIYVSGHDGNGVCQYHGQPCSVTIPFAQALEQCRSLGGRTDIAWNGTVGEWYEIQTVKLGHFDFVS